MTAVNPLYRALFIGPNHRFYRAQLFPFTFFKMNKIISKDDSSRSKTETSETRYQPIRFSDRYVYIFGSFLFILGRDVLFYLSMLERLPTINKLFGLSGIAQPKIGRNVRVVTGLENSKTVENERYLLFTYL